MRRVEMAIWKRGDASHELQEGYAETKRNSRNSRVSFAENSSRRRTLTLLTAVVISGNATLPVAF